MERFASTSCATGAVVAPSDMARWMARPKGNGLKVLLAALRESGVLIKGSSFDAISLPDASVVDFSDAAQVKSALPGPCAWSRSRPPQSRVQPGLSGFFIALTAREIVAAEALGPRHLWPCATQTHRGAATNTSPPAILARTEPSNGQLSVQL